MFYSFINQVVGNWFTKSLMKFRLLFSSSYNVKLLMGCLPEELSIKITYMDVDDSTGMVDYLDGQLRTVGSHQTIFDIEMHTDPGEAPVRIKAPYSLFYRNLTPVEGMVFAGLLMDSPVRGLSIKGYPEFFDRFSVEFIKAMPPHLTRYGYGIYLAGRWEQLRVDRV